MHIGKHGIIKGLTGLNPEFYEIVADFTFEMLAAVSGVWSGYQITTVTIFHKVSCG